MKKVLLFLALLSYLNSFSQHKKIIYADEYFNTISFTNYQKKLSSNLFDIAEIENDTAIIKKLRYASYYGKLKAVTNRQLSKILNKRFNIDTTKTLLIHYINSVPDIKKMPKESGIEFLDSLNNNTGIFLTESKFKTDLKKYSYNKHKHVLSKDDFFKKIKSERKKFSKKIELIHFYKTNNGFPVKKLSPYNYFKDDNNLISRLFSDKTKMYKVILIHPNGEFYVSKFSHGSFLREKKLTKKSFYKKEKKIWKKKLTNLSNKSS